MITCYGFILFAIIEFAMVHQNSKFLYKNKNFTFYDLILFSEKNPNFKQINNFKNNNNGFNKTSNQKLKSKNRTNYKILTDRKRFLSIFCRNKHKKSDLEEYEQATEELGISSTKPSTSTIENSAVPSTSAECDHLVNSSQSVNLKLKPKPKRFLQKNNSNLIFKLKMFKFISKLDQLVKFLYPILFLLYNFVYFSFYLMRRN